MAFGIDRSRPLRTGAEPYRGRFIRFSRLGSAWR
jgi:hypothetical protein